MPSEEKRLNKCKAIPTEVRTIECVYTSEV